MTQNLGFSSSDKAVQNLLGGHPPIMKGQTILSTGTARALLAGMVLGKVTASGKLTEYTPGASDGSQNAFGILAEDVAVPAAGDELANVFFHGEFKKTGLSWGSAVTTQAHKDAAYAALQALSIICK